MTPRDWDRPEVREGTERMLAARAVLLGRGERTIGWKLAFGAPHWLEKFRLSGPLVGYLPESRRRPPGAAVPVEAWRHPVAEPELAVHLVADVDPDRAADAIVALGPALELADVDPPPEDLAAVLAGNVYHRAVILGEPDPGRAGGDLSGLRARVTRDGEEIADTADLESLTGELVAILAHAARLLAAAGERIRAGEVVIMGSVIPPVPLHPGDTIHFELAPLPAISVRV